MGNLRFSVSDPGQTDPRVWQTAFITGIEGVPWHCRHQLQSDQFIIGRELDESGKVNIVWPTRSCGNLCLATGSLRETPTSYGLAVEIARGTVGRLKNQTAEWQRIGLKLPNAFFPLAEQGLSNFLRSLTSAGNLERQEELAQSAIDSSIQASTVLCQAFSQQALMSRRSNEGPLTTLLGVTLPSKVDLDGLSEKLHSAFNMVNIKADLGQVEQASGQIDYRPFDAQVDWATQQNLKISVGPLVDFRPERLPQWMILLGEDYESIVQAACKHAKNTVDRYRNRTQIWNCAVGLNSPNSMHWSDEEVLRMAVAVISTVRQADSRTPVVLTIEQPWSEYLRDNPRGISPLHFADALIRADLGLSGLALELAFDVWPGGSFPRDLIELSRLIDRWAMLGIPLMIHLSSPTLAASGSGCRVSDWKFRFNGKTHSHDPHHDPHPDHPSSESSPSAQEQGRGFLPPESIVQLLVSKLAVHGVVWDQLTDQFPVATSSSGVWDSCGVPKKILNDMQEIRSNFLL